MRPAEQALRTWINKNSGRKPALSADLSAGELRPADHTLVVRAPISGSGIIELINISKPEERGTLNLDKGRFPENEIFAFDRVSVKFADSAAASAKAVNTYSGDSQSMPAALRNGELALLQNDGEIFRTLVDDCAGAVDSEFAAGRADSKELVSPVVIEDNKIIKLLLEGAEGEAFTTGVTNTAYVEVKFYGVRVKQKARG